MESVLANFGAAASFFSLSYSSVSSSFSCFSLFSLSSSVSPTEEVEEKVERSRGGAEVDTVEVRKNTREARRANRLASTVIS